MILLNLSKYCLSICLLLLTLSCSQSNKTDEFYAELDRTLSNSIPVIKNQNRELYDEITTKSTNAVYQDAALDWYPKAKQIKESSEVLLEYLDKKNVDRKELSDKLYSFKTSYLNIDSQFTQDLKPIDIEFLDSSKIQNLLSALNSKNTSTILLKLQSDVVTLQNIGLHYCSGKFSFINDIFVTNFSVLLSQNSKIFRPGEELEITTGIGAISQAAQPRFVIQGMEVLPQDNGLCVFRRKVPNELGKYTLPVEIKFTGPDGTKYEKQLQVEYTVGFN